MHVLFRWDCAKKQLVQNLPTSGLLAAGLPIERVSEGNVGLTPVRAPGWAPPQLFLTNFLPGLPGIGLFPRDVLCSAGFSRLRRKAPTMPKVKKPFQPQMQRRPWTYIWLSCHWHHITVDLRPVAKLSEKCLFSLMFLHVSVPIYETSCLFWLYQNSRSPAVQSKNEQRTPQFFSAYYRSDTYKSFSGKWTLIYFPWCYL